MARSPSRHRALSRLRARAAAGLSLHPAAVFRDEPETWHRSCELFGTFRRALVAAGVDPDAAFRHPRRVAEPRQSLRRRSPPLPRAPRSGGGKGKRGAAAWPLQDERLIEVLSRRVDETLASIGHSMGITRERVRQLQNRALAGLRLWPPFQQAVAAARARLEERGGSLPVAAIEAELLPGDVLQEPRLLRAVALAVRRELASRARTE